MGSIQVSGYAGPATTVDTGAGLSAEPGCWTATHHPSTATQATATKAAGGAGVRHVCNGISATVAAGATAQTPVTVYLRDGGTGAGTILWSASLSAPANSCAVLNVTGLRIVGTANTAMTLEFSGAGVAASQEDVTLTGYDAM